MIYNGSYGLKYTDYMTYEPEPSNSDKTACVPIKVSDVLVPWLPTGQFPAKLLTRLCGCEGCSESSLGALAISFMMVTIEGDTGYM